MLTELVTKLEQVHEPSVRHAVCCVLCYVM